MDIQVVKRDGSLESFDPDKIIRVVAASGLDPEPAAILASNVTDWIKSLHQDKISSLQIRDKVIELLQNTDQNAANLFSWYQKTKG